MPRPPSMEEEILAVLERALEEGQAEAAEHLLRPGGTLRGSAAGVAPGGHLPHGNRCAGAGSVPPLKAAATWWQDTQLGRREN